MVTGNPLSLTVNITEFNLPLTEITWFIGGTPTANVTDSALTITNTSTTSPPATSTLTLDLIQFPAQGGQYSVTVVNPAGMDTFIFNVTVNGKEVIVVTFGSGYIMIVPTAAADIIFPSDPMNETVTEGSQVNLTCIARGVPPPKVLWYKGSELISDSDTRLQASDSQMFNSSTGFIYVVSQLSISIVNRNDNTVFRCVAANTVPRASSNDSQTYSLIVYCKL